MRAEPPGPKTQHPLSNVLIGEPRRPGLTANHVEVTLQQRSLMLVHAQASDKTRASGMGVGLRRSDWRRSCGLRERQKLL